MKQAAEQHVICNKNTFVSIQNELKELRQLFEAKSQQLNSIVIILNDTLERLRVTENDWDFIAQEIKSAN